MFWPKLLRALTSRYPLNTPRASILNMLPEIPAGYGEFEGKHGFRYRGYWAGQDEICRSLFWLGDFDPWVDHTLTWLARPGSVALDIGANIGATALALGRAVGPKGRVFCFEPMPPNIDHLRQNIEANNFAMIEVVPAALSDKAGELWMKLPEDGAAGRSSVTTNADQKAAFRVKSMAFDDWLESQPPMDISVCKIDVEGHEAQVLAGMDRTLSKRAIPAIVFERHVDRMTYGDPIFGLMAGKGYRVFRIEKGLSRVAYVELEQPPVARLTHDFVAVLPGVSLEA